MVMKLSKRYSILWILVLFLPVFGIDKWDISSKELKTHVSFLASDKLKGRKAGTFESDKAAKYIKNKFSKYGLQFLSDNGFQSFQVLTAVQAGENNYFHFGQFTGTLSVDYTPLNFSENGQKTAPVAFVGYGFDFNSDSVSWHDYRGIDINGKWALVLRDGPEVKGTQDVFEPYRSLRKKVLTAKDLGAVGVIFVSGENSDKDDQLISLRDDPSTSNSGLIVVQLKRAVADQFLQKNGNNIASLEKQLNDTLQPHSFMISDSITARADIVHHMSTTSNVVAFISGQDPFLKNEYIVLGAHYDHLGMGGFGSGSRRPDTLAVHNGADDNASGVAAVLEIAQKLSAHRKELKRSVLFVAFAAEEMGTLGSRYFTDHSPVDLNKTQLMINLDMVGKLDDSTKAFTLGGTGTAIGLSDIVQNLALQHNLHPNLSPEGYGPSDHASFYSKDIPVLFFMTNITELYHTPDDDVETINFEGEKLIADLVYDVIIQMSNRTDALVYQEAGPKSQPPTSRRFKVTLGIMPDFVASAVKGVRAQAVLPGRPAARAGMLKGDIVIAMEGKPVNDIYEYMNRLADFRAGQRISVEILRNNKKEILIIEL